MGDVLAIASSATDPLARTLSPVFGTNSLTWRIYKSSNGDDSWTQAGSQPASFIVVSGTTLISRVTDWDWYAEVHGVFRSRDNGTTWAPANHGLTDSSVNCFAVTPSSIFAGTAHGVFRSTNDGLSWTPAGLTNSVNAFALSGTNIFEVTHGESIFLSPDNGITWTPVMAGFADSMVQALFCPRRISLWCGLSRYMAANVLRDDYGSKAIVS